MGRLITALGFTLLLVGPVAAQVTSPMYSIVGDVERPQTYRFDDSNSISVADLLRTAGIIEPGTAMILRGSPLVAISREYVDLSTPNAGSTLTPGDVVIFRSQSGVIPGHPNACVMIGDKRAVLPLAEGFHSVAALLQQCGLPASLSVPVSRTAQETATAAMLNANQSIQHGDVADLSAYTVSAQHSEKLFATAPADMHAADNLAITQSGADESGWTAESPETPDASNWPVALDLSPPEDQSEESGSDGTVESSQTPFRVASLQEFSDELAPAPPSVAIIDSSPLNAEPTGSAVMNTIFIGGLMFAMGLIAIGWIRTKRERAISGSIPVVIEEPFSAPTAASEEQDATSTESTPAAEAVVATTYIAGTEENAAQADAVPSGAPLNAAVWFDDGHETSDDADTPSPYAQTQSEPVEVIVEPLREGGKWSELEDLIQNRVPVERTEAELPLHVSLYGRPAGPQRIRIDAAHHQIDAPHVLKRAPAKPQPETAQTAVPTSEKPASEGTARPRTSTADFSRLDKALNFLEEQSDS